MEINKQNDQTPVITIEGQSKWCVCSIKLLKQIAKGIAFNPVVVMTVLGIFGNAAFKHQLSIYIEGLLQVSWPFNNLFVWVSFVFLLIQFTRFWIHIQLLWKQDIGYNLFVFVKDIIYLKVFLVLDIYSNNLFQVFGQSFAATALFLLGLRMVGQIHRLRGPALLLPCVLIMVKL